MCRSESAVRITHVPTGLSCLVRWWDRRGETASIVGSSRRARALLAAMVAARLRDPEWRWTDANKAGEPKVRTCDLFQFRTRDHPDGKITSGEWRELDPALFSNYPGPALDRLMLERRKAAGSERDA